VKSNENPFTLGQSDAEAGKAWKNCPFSKGSHEWVRYMSGFQAGISARQKAMAQKAQTQVQALQAEVEDAAVR
jgi:hypothetical protein